MCDQSRRCHVDSRRIRLLRWVWCATVGALGCLLAVGPIAGQQVTVLNAPTGLLITYGLALALTSAVAATGHRTATLIAATLMFLWAVELAVVLAGPATGPISGVVTYAGLAAAGLVLSIRTHRWE